MGKTLGVVLLCACAAAARAQTTTSSILGQVRAETGAALPGVEITARHLESGLVRTTTAEPTGHFALAALPVGIYEVRVSFLQFRPLVRCGIALVVGEPVVLSFIFILGATEDEITVIAEATGVRTRFGDLSYFVSEAAIRDLP
jgi:hypothetical protein